MEKTINTVKVPNPDYTPINSIPYSELEIGRKYSFTYENNEVEGILMKKNSIYEIEFKLINKYLTKSGLSREINIQISKEKSEKILKRL
mgnify:CR=1 FL=1